MTIETVENQIFYHIQQGEVPAGGHTWEIGKKDNWGEEENFVLKNVFNEIGKPLVNEFTNESNNSFLAFENMYCQLMNQTASLDSTNFILSNLNSILWLYTEMFASLNNHVYVLREYIIEEMRKKVNPDLPSRFTGLWATPEKDLNFWWHVLTPQETNTIIKLKLTGKIFKGHSYWQPKIALSIDEWRDVARHYWNSDPGPDPNGRYEYLFEGESEVLEVLQPEAFGLKNPQIFKGCPIPGTY